jgi:hypothetical protein
MITSRALVKRDATTMHMITFDPDEQPRSLQLYEVDALTTHSCDVVHNALIGRQARFSPKGSCWSPQ